MLLSFDLCWNVLHKCISTLSLRPTRQSMVIVSAMRTDSPAWAPQKRVSCLHTTLTQPPEHSFVQPTGPQYKTTQILWLHFLINATESPCTWTQQIEMTMPGPGSNNTGEQAYHGGNNPQSSWGRCRENQSFYVDSIQFYIITFIYEEVTKITNIINTPMIQTWGSRASSHSSALLVLSGSESKQVSAAIAPLVAARAKILQLVHSRMQWRVKSSFILGGVFLHGFAMTMFVPKCTAMLAALWGCTCRPCANVLTITSLTCWCLAGNMFTILTILM